MKVAFELDLNAWKKKKKASGCVFKSKANEKNDLTLEVEAEMQFEREKNSKRFVQSME